MATARPSAEILPRGCDRCAGRAGTARPHADRARLARRSGRRPRRRGRRLPGQAVQLRRARSPRQGVARRDSTNGGATIRSGSLELDAARHEARRYERRLDLTPKEFALLRYLLLHPGEVLTPERLLEHVWDEQADPFSNTVRVTISNLRRKLADAGPGQPIQTVVGVGYRLDEAPA